MPRQTRQFEEGGIYHVLNRGVEKRKIFSKTQDYHRFILGLEFFNSSDTTDLWHLLARGGSDPPRARVQSVGERLASQRTKQKWHLVDLLAFVLMPNHFHLILREIHEGGISAFMKKLGGYAMYFNKQYHRVGPLFQSRYKAVPIKSDAQLSVIYTYVHTNPVEIIEPLWKKENKVFHLDKALAYLNEYPWTSYHDYVGRPQFPFVTQRDYLSDYFGSAQACQREVEEWVEHKAAMADFDRREFE